MKGKTRCPYCNKNVIVEVNNNSFGVTKTQCPNCALMIRVDVREDTPHVNGSIHPTLKRKEGVHQSVSKLTYAGVLLIIAGILGCISGATFFLAEDAFFGYDGVYSAKVVDDLGNPISGVNISFIDNSNYAYTNNEGLFSIKGPVGENIILLKLEGYEQKIAKIGIFPIEPIITEKFTLHQGTTTLNITKPSGQIFEFIPLFFGTILALSVFPLISSICCFIKRYHMIAIIGAIIGVFSIGFFIGSILSIVALILIFTSKNEFADI